MFGLMISIVMGFSALVTLYMYWDDKNNWQDGRPLTYAEIGARKLAHANPHLRGCLMEAGLL
jgi:hypothetical protein